MIALMAAFAVPMALAEDNDSDSSDAIALYNDTSNITEGLVISPGPSTETTETAAELDAEENATIGFGDIFMNRVQTWFTWNQEKKVELELKLAKMRLIQAKIAAKNNNTEAMEKALEAHEEIMNRIQERMSKLDGASDINGLNNSAVKLIGLERAIQVHEARINRFNLMLENANLTDEQRTRIESKISKAEGVTSKLQELSDEKQDRIKIKLMAVGNLTEDEANQIIEQRHEKIENRVQEKLEHQAEIREKMKSGADDSEDTADTEVNNESEVEED